jgi:hypothetical protein
MGIFVLILTLTYLSTKLLICGPISRFALLVFLFRFFLQMYSEGISAPCSILWTKERKVNTHVLCK